MSIRRFIEHRRPLPDALRVGVEQARLQLGDAEQLARVRAGVERRLGGPGGGASAPPFAGVGGWSRGQWLLLVGTPMAGLLLALWLGVVPGATATALSVAPGEASPDGAQLLPNPSYLLLGRASQPEPIVEAVPDGGAPLRAARARTEPSPKSARTLDPRGEIEILRAAQAALRTRPSTSLEQVQEHETRYPEGVFAQEREVIRVDALFALQRDGEARERVRAFLAQFGSSTHAPRMRTLLGEP